MEPTDAARDEKIVPRALSDDPITGDGSAGREGVEIASWRLKTLDQDELGDVSEPGRTAREQRRARRAHERSRNARNERRRTHRRRWRTVVATLVLLAAVGAAAAGITYVMELWGGRTIPEVEGISQGNARALLEAKGFAVTIETEPSDVLEGSVVRVVPPAGTRVEEGSAVTLTVGTARHMPQVVGLMEAEARERLEDAGAHNVRIISRQSFEPDGTVIESRPQAEAVFMSTDEVVLVVSQPPRMPDVVGEWEDVAQALVEREEVSWQVIYERATVDERLRVLRTEPSAGEAVGEQGATLVVGDPLVEVLRLGDYFDAKAPHIRDFVTTSGLAEKVAHLTQDGHLVARFEDGQGSYLALTKEPWSHAVADDHEPASDVFADSTKVEGVRVSVPIVRAVYVEKPAEQSGEKDGSQDDEQPDDATADQAEDAQGDAAAKQEEPIWEIKEPAHAASLITLSAPAVDEACAREVMQACGFGEMLDSCTQDDIKLPEGTDAKGKVFYACFGEVERRVWTILIKGIAEKGRVEATEVVLTCAPRSTYATIDLTPFDGSVCDYVAYQDVYAK